MILISQIALVGDTQAPWKNGVITFSRALSHNLQQSTFINHFFYQHVADRFQWFSAAGLWMSGFSAEVQRM